MRILANYLTFQTLHCQTWITHVLKEYRLRIWPYQTCITHVLRPVCLAELQIPAFLTPVRNAEILVRNEKWGSNISNFRIYEILSFKKEAQNSKFHRNIQPKKEFLPAVPPPCTYYRNFIKQKFLVEILSNKYTRVGFACFILHSKNVQFWVSC